MQTWLKYAVSFFVLVLVLAGFIFAFGPASTRAAFKSGETQTGQLSADHTLVTPGEPAGTSSAPAQNGTYSGTTQGSDAAPNGANAPGGGVSQPPGPQPLTDGAPSSHTGETAK